MEEGQAQIFRGVVPKKNGNWGAQVSVNRKPLWLGTYETVVEAANAYDRANLKLRRLSALNIPWYDRPQEIEFQSMYPFATVISMIKNGTYTQNYAYFMTDEAILARNQCLAGARNRQQSSGETGISGVTEVHNPVKLFSVRIG
ncbi:AP2/ERF and B3 domain-containing transcription factor At1g51120 [Beta vulgaris subsp. vulgaris]|uniref:AP2/ERF and B3 domain-containing transcription factor At1g51120 n=1 Tax=Beta vulgaris subsp. vulgaris TaxID=3555 RepID=UPI00203711FC|nr:AP2/ERF and B3 domain-containing transcription factor At1g51120 [Beta vulgaris subsp. vulgaris]